MPLEPNQTLQSYAKSHTIDKLSSEDIIKLMTKPYIIEEIAEAFNITEKEFKNIKKKKGIPNIFLEDTIRDIETILTYLDSKNKYFSNTIRKKLTNIMISIFLSDTPKKSFYIKKISEIDFNRKKVINDIQEKQIDQEWRLERLSKFTIYMEEKMETLIKEEKNYLFNDNSNKLYNRLIKDQNKGKSFKKEDLTYDILFELSVIENKADTLIGNIYNMNKNQVKYLRKKLGLNNIYKTKMETYPEIIMYMLEEKHKRPENISNYEFEKLITKIIQVSNTPSNHGNNITIDNNGEIITYHTEFSNEEYKTKPNKKGNKKKTQGSHHNYKKENETKILHGKIGEKIALEAEKKRLIQLGLEDLVEKVQLISQISEEITFDGLGYDLISFNEKREKVCIEVKTSYGKSDKPFFISKKELELLQGLKEEHNCSNCLIYYVLIDNNNVIIKNINLKDLNNLKLTPILYKVESNDNEIAK